MKGLLIKDFLGIKTNIKTNIFTLLIFIIMGIALKNVMYITMMVAVLSLNQTIIALSYDEMAKWTEYSISMPVTKKEIIKEKYLFSLIILIFGFIISTVFSYFGIYLRNGIGLKELLFTNYLIFFTMALINMIILPLIYKLGVEKSRTALFGVAMLPTFIVFAVLYFIPKPDPVLILKILKGFLILSPFILFILGNISMKISTKILNTKDL